jgi:hypothetical protein
MAVSVVTRLNREPDRRGKYITPIRVYRIADGSLATEPDSSGKSYLAYSAENIVDDKADIEAIMALVNPPVVKEVEAPTNKDASEPTSNKSATKPVRKKRSRKK